MKTRYTALIVILIAAGAFLAGSWVTYQGGRGKTTAERKILHYVDPMNPAFKSDKPGIAPCGMPLEPVYADQGETTVGGADPRASLPPGTIRISPEKQQLIGVKTAIVEKAPWSHTLRVLGRVTPDETRTYRINAAANGWIEDALPVTTGSQVKENEILATYYSLEYRNLVQNYFNLINISKEGAPGEKAVTRTSRYSTGQLRQLREAASAMGQAVSESSQVDFYRRNLYNFGMSPYQVNEMERTRMIPDFIEIRAPVGGFVLYRNVSAGLRFDRGTEFFRIADLSRVWILADIFETEASYFKPGTRVKMELPYQKRTLYAEVSPVLPQFDPATRTLKVRLEADNPGYVMRPDMFVNVELPVSGGPAIIVPVDAVLDSGLKKTVFVDKGSGFFEPRQVETGRSLGERVEVTGGLMSGEKIVVSGNFLIDSEARMQQAASGIFGKIGRDPVCGMNIDEDRARSEGNFLEYRGRTYFFCDSNDRELFRKDAERYLKSPSAQRAMPMAGSQDADAKHLSHAPASAPKTRGAKTVPEAHDSMAMPMDQTPAAMPGMPAASPMTGSKEKGMTIPSATAPGMTPQPPALPRQGGMPMSMPQGAAEMSGPRVGGMTPASAAPGMTPQPPAFPRTGDAPMPGPPTGSTLMPGSNVRGEFSPPAGGPGMSQQAPTFPGSGPGAAGMPMPGPSGAVPMPGGKAGEMSPPATGIPGMNPGPSPFPGQGSMQGRMPQEAAPLPGAQPGEIAPQRPATRTPAINPRLQRYRSPGPAPKAGPQEVAPVPRGETGGTSRSSAGTPDMTQGLPPSFPGSLPPPQMTAPVSGTKSEGTSSSATDTPEVKR